MISTCEISLPDGRIITSEIHYIETTVGGLGPLLFGWKMSETREWVQAFKRFFLDGAPITENQAWELVKPHIDDCRASCSYSDH